MEEIDLVPIPRFLNSQNPELVFGCTLEGDSGIEDPRNGLKTFIRKQ